MACEIGVTLDFWHMPRKIMHYSKARDFTFRHGQPYKKSNVVTILGIAGSLTRGTHDVAFSNVFKQILCCHTLFKRSLIHTWTHSVLENLFVQCLRIYVSMMLFYERYVYDGCYSLQFVRFGQGQKVTFFIGRKWSAQQCFECAGVTKALTAKSLCKNCKGKRGFALATPSQADVDAK